MARTPLLTCLGLKLFILAACSSAPQSKLIFDAHKRDSKRENTSRHQLTAPSSHLAWQAQLHSSGTHTKVLALSGTHQCLPCGRRHPAWPLSPPPTATAAAAPAPLAAGLGSPRCWRAFMCSVQSGLLQQRSMTLLQALHLRGATSWWRWMAQRTRSMRCSGLCRSCTRQVLATPVFVALQAYLAPQVVWCGGGTASLQYEQPHVPGATLCCPCAGDVIHVAHCIPYLPASAGLYAFPGAPESLAVLPGGAGAASHSAATLPACFVVRSLPPGCYFLPPSPKWPSACPLGIACRWPPGDV